MQKIQKLPPQLADMIAAGEVVERPGSVVKELVENSIDAGATSLTIEIQNGGMSYIRVTDNGSGMSEEDAGLAFLRHATSKLRNERDLEAIRTLGFRGEALAAISAVSRIELMTREAGRTEGTALTVHGGEIIERSPVGCPQGTTIIVRDLFFNTPARLKFMKKDAAEAANVSAVVLRIALSHPEVAFRYIKDGKEEAVTSGNGDVSACIYSLLGRDFSKGLIRIESGDDTISAQGYITSPGAARGNRSAQYMYVNGRYVKSQLLQAALEQGYKNSLFSGRYPGCVIYLNIKPSAVDVNVHPAKTEVRFLNERAVFDCVYYAVKTAVEAQRPPVSEETPAFSKQPETPYREVKTPESGSVPYRAEPYKEMTVEDYLKGNIVRSPVSGYDFGAKAAAGQSGPAADLDRPVPENTVSDTELTSSDKHADGEEGASDHIRERLNAERETAGTEPVSEKAPEFKIIGEAFSGYIIVQAENELIFVDKHAAHERLIFDRLRSCQGEQMSQFLLAPLTVELGREEAALLLDSADIYGPLGFEIEDFGGGTVLVRRLPADIDEQDVPSLLGELCQCLSKGERPGSLGIRDEILSTIACKAAVKIGRSSDPAEMKSIVEHVMAGRVRFCPHGRPVTMNLSKLQLEKGFKRK